MTGCSPTTRSARISNGLGGRPLSWSRTEAPPYLEFLLIECRVTEAILAHVLCQCKIPGHGVSRPLVQHQASEWCGRASRCVCIRIGITVTAASANSCRRAALEQNIELQPFEAADRVERFRTTNQSSKRQRMRRDTSRSALELETTQAAITGRHRGHEVTIVGLKG